jgi:aspartyl/asparaginyl-tRNA synthetase
MHSYRSEEPDARHLAQFVHAEMEIPGSLDDVIICAEDHIRSLALALVQDCRRELKDIAGDISHVEKMASGETRFESISFDECDALLEGKREYIEVLQNGARSLTPNGETALRRILGTEFLWVRNWDSLAVPFYQASEGDEGLARNADLLFGVGEVVGAGERHSNVAALDASLAAHEISATSYDWYRLMKEQFPLRTSGYGMGVERFLAWSTQSFDIRNFQLFPRNQDQSGIP